MMRIGLPGDSLHNPEPVYVIWISELMDGIRPKGHPIEAAERAYAAGYYIEAVQILQAWVENQARSLLTLIGNVNFGAKSKDTWDVSDSLTFQNVLKCLFVLNQISKTEFDEFSQLNKLRNRVVHELYSDPYDKQPKSISQSEFKLIFLRSLDQANFFTNKCDALV